MKRALAWLAGILGIAALGRMLAKRRRPPAPVAPESEPEPAAADDPAEELRRRLAEQKVVSEQVAEDETVPVDETLAERRARVHAKAREAIDAMHDDDGPAA